MSEIDMAISQLQPGMVAVLGVPLDENSTFLRGSARAPERIRQVLHAGSGNLCVESGLDLGEDTRWLDVGDMELGTGEVALQQIEEMVTRLLTKGVRVLTLGGDHSITYPILRAYAKQYPQLTLLHLDAHPDLHDEYNGSRLTHASPFARIMEEHLVVRLIQVGIRTANPHQRQQAKRFGVTMVEMRDWSPAYDLALEGPVYLSFDIDALDPAFAPGISHHEPGGFTTREILSIIQSLSVPLVGADFVEYNPLRDIFDMTAMVGAKFYKELVACMLA